MLQNVKLFNEYSFKILLFYCEILQNDKKFCMKAAADEEPTFEA
jgi:hypothetical protein